MKKTATKRLAVDENKGEDVLSESDVSENRKRKKRKRTEDVSDGRKKAKREEEEEEGSRNETPVPIPSGSRREGSGEAEEESEEGNEGPAGSDDHSAEISIQEDVELEDAHANEGGNISANNGEDGGNGKIAMPAKDQR
jgi:hypothetical protein